jgi:exodeoxyribonuclease V alpha subunit
METYIKGNFRRSIFNSDKGYVIGIFKVRETNDDSLEEYVNHTITFTGYFHDLNEDDTYVFYGEGVKHPRYGFQFQVNNYERLKPTDKDGIVTFLSSDLFPGVGEKLALDIVSVLGENTIDRILKEPGCLNLVPKLTLKKADKIVHVLKKYEESHETIVYLTDLGFSMREALSVYNEYESNTLKLIQDNIYQITYNLKDISFSKIDSVALNLNIKKDDSRRVKAACLEVMTKLIYQNGDSFLSKDQIIRATDRFLGFPYEEYDEIFMALSDDDKIIIDNEDYYLKEIWDAEANIVSRLHYMANKEEVKYNKIDDLISGLEKKYDIKYNDEQKKAIKKALESNFLIITGGPGTGKTTIIKAITEIYQLLNKLDYDEFTNVLALLAPTGRASKRMSESTLLPASTIHRFLKWNKDNGEFMINEDNKSLVKLVIVDEVSMIDVNLFDSLLKGLRANVKMILVGDYNQLPSVGPGQLLKDLICSDCLPIVQLNHLYRQDEDSYIISLAQEIKDGDLSENYLNTYSDYTFLKCSADSIKKNLNNLCQQIISKGYDYKRVQLLAPMYKGENGIDLLNKELQEVFNPASKEKREVKSGDVIFRENDKILQLVNMPDENIYNGDLGVIKYIKYGNTSKSKKNEIYVDFDGNLVKYMPKDLVKIKHGFIISIHKSQGSEFEMVIMPMTKAYFRMLYRKLIYTAVTRAKKKLIIIGETEAFRNSVYNNNEYNRNSKLLEKIQYKFYN